MNLIHLTSRQTKQAKFNHPLLENSKELEADVLDKLIEFYIASHDKTAFDDLILGNLILVKWVVGRFLYHWPESREFEDDMASEGIVAITEIVTGLTEVLPGVQLRAMIVARVKGKIERYLNDNRSLVRASTRTNQRRFREGKDLEYTNTVQLDERAVSALDDNLAAIDILDSLDSIESIDNEELIDAVMLAIEHHPQLLESELSLPLKELIERIVKALKG